MRDIIALFIDDGGVMSDNALRGTEWPRLVAEFFVPILGGDHASWVKANKVVFRHLEPTLTAGPHHQDYGEWIDAYRVLWLKEMADYVGVAAPSDDAQCLELAWQASDYITQQVHASYAGTRDAIIALYKMGFMLFTASAEHSRELEGILKGMEVRDQFKSLYGTDLVNAAKSSDEYYRRVFDHSGIVPDQAMVVDDSPRCLAWASGLGASTCFVDRSSGHTAKVDLAISSLEELPVILQKTIQSKP